MTQSAYPLFEHSNTSFSLVRHSFDYNTNPMPCQACHATEAGFTFTNTACGSCHAQQDREFVLDHIVEFSQDCLICHDGEDRMTLLDHQSTRFPLEGKHREINCIECHSLESASTLPETGRIQAANLLPVTFQMDKDVENLDPFKNTPIDCNQCHMEPEVHKGYFTGECAECHTSEGWEQALLDGNLFDHTAISGFSLAHHSLNYKNQPLVCRDCHQQDLNNINQQSCITCHGSGQERAVFLQAHQEMFGAGCLECHDGADRMSDFDHERFFPLAGRHAGLECAACHLEKEFIGTPSECVQCHAEPAIHAGFFGLQCQYCHTAQAWIPAQLRFHIFPLDHGDQGENACQVCHPANYSEYTCYGCHDHQPEPIAESHQQADIRLESLANCIECHADGNIEIKD